jgi:hypothetical protein
MIGDGPVGIRESSTPVQINRFAAFTARSMRGAVEISPNLLFAEIY